MHHNLCPPQWPTGTHSKCQWQLSGVLQAGERVVRVAALSDMHTQVCAHPVSDRSLHFSLKLSVTVSDIARPGRMAGM